MYYYSTVPVDCSGSLLKKRNPLEVLACLTVWQREGAQASLSTQSVANLVLTLVLLCSNSPEADLVYVITFLGFGDKSESKKCLETRLLCLHLAKFKTNKAPGRVGLIRWAVSLMTCLQLSPGSFAFAPWTAKFLLAEGFSCIARIPIRKTVFVSWSVLRADNLFLLPGNLLVEEVLILMINRWSGWFFLLLCS